jgi:hypothetical protein
MTMTDTVTGAPVRTRADARDLHQLDLLGLALATVMTLGPLLATALFAH